MDHSRKELGKLLLEAHTNELALLTVLKSHIQLTDNEAYKKLLENHLQETAEHAEGLERRLEELEYAKGALAIMYEAAQGIVKQVLVLTKAPIDMLRGGRDTNEKMLKNAMDEVMTEGLEIAAYDAIEAIALSLGDTVTAELAASIRLDEEAMFNDLRKMIPVLATEVAAETAPSAGLRRPWPGYDEMTVEHDAAKR